MVEFGYRVKTKTGELLEGSIEAPSETTAVDVLHERGYTVLSLVQASKNIFAVDLNQFLSRPKNKDIVIFTRQLATLIDADVPLAESLRTLSRQTEKPGFKKTIALIADAVEGGSSLSAALANHPKLFSNFYVKLVRSGELSGKLHDSLNYLADYLERTQAINSKVRGALAYPAFVIFAMVVVGIIMTVYVLPQLLSIFKESGITDLPITTRALIVITNFVNNNLIIIILLVVGIPVGFWRWIKSESGRVWWDDTKIRVPLFGRILSNLYLSRMSESLATLIRSDLAILDAIKITAELVGNQNYQEILLDAEENIRGGGTLSETLAKYGEVPPLFASMVAIGERTGKIEYMLDHVSKFYRTESEDSINNIAQLIEPVLVFVLGIGVALLVSSVLLPIYSLVGSS